MLLLYWSTFLQNFKNFKEVIKVQSLIKWKFRLGPGYNFYSYILPIFRIKTFFFYLFKKCDKIHNFMHYVQILLKLMPQQRCNKENTNLGPGFWNRTRARVTTFTNCQYLHCSHKDHNKRYELLLNCRGFKVGRYPVLLPAWDRV